jgi:hypothetical protein
MVAEVNASLAMFGIEEGRLRHGPRRWHGLRQKYGGMVFGKKMRLTYFTRDPQDATLYLTTLAVTSYCV